jgi:hypothetical protein
VSFNAQGLQDQTVALQTSTTSAANWKQIGDDERKKLHPLEMFIEIENSGLKLPKNN